MTLEHSDPWLDIHLGDVRDVLPTLPVDSVDCIVTSPPYWGLRDYGETGQLGLERTPEEYVANLVAVFRELRRVLKPAGTCWLNLGDSYAAGKTGRGDAGRVGENGFNGGGEVAAFVANRPPPPGLKPKDLVGIPWRVAFALQADGWYLRSDIIWAKPNPMPESVTDRPTKAHEYLFLLTKSARYYFDADAVREPNARLWDESNMGEANKWATGEKEGKVLGRATEPNKGLIGSMPNPAGRNLRSVWTIATRPYPGAHFAVFPPELPERCIKAGSSERGVCPHTGEPWERVIERGAVLSTGGSKTGARATNLATVSPNGQTPDNAYNTGTFVEREHVTTGWRPTCDHDAAPVPAVVLDPFAGSGTVGMVANRLSRRAILIDLNGEYLKQQLKRNAQTPLGLT